MRFVNLHTHTQFCDGRSSIDQMARAAVEQGFTTIGFTPHSPIPIPSPCNMKASDVPEYFREVNLARERYGDRCRILAGMEIDYLNPDWCAASPYFVNLDLDFAISSVHFIPDREGNYIDIDGPYDRFARNMDEHFHGDIRYVVETFFDQSTQMLERGGFTILGHFDKIAMNAAQFDTELENHTWYQNIIGQYIDKIIDSGVTIEINTKAYDKIGRFFPHERYWEGLINAGVPIVVNSDAHQADRLNASRMVAIDKLSALGYAI